MKKQVLTFLIISVFASLGFMQAQVTIGSNIEPSAGALLDVKENASVAPTPNSTKGVLFPKVALQGRNVLQPLFSGTPTTEDSLRTTGMVVYNTSGDNIMTEGPGLYVWDGKEWIPVAGKANTGFERPECNTIGVSGLYMKDISITPTTNYIEMELAVLTTGRYSITAKSDPDNGYSFSTVEEFNQPGLYAIRIEGEGVPVNASPANTPDVFSIRINGFNTGCTAEITVEEPAADFEINCDNITVNGEYSVNKPLIPGTNTITIQLSVPAEAVGTDFSIETNTSNGCKFSAVGTLTTTPAQTVTLAGEGTPIKSGVIEYEISTNSISGTSCFTGVQVKAKEIKILGLSTSDWYAIENGSGDMQGAMRKLLLKPVLFGPTGSGATVTVEKFNFIKNPNNNANAYYNPADSTELGKLIRDEQPDIIMVGYTFTSQARAANCLIVLEKFINDGGVVILTGDYTINILPFIRNVFGDQNITLQATGDGPNTMAFNNVSHPIITGPFLNLNGYYMQRDAGGNFELKNLTNATTLVTNNNGARVAVHNTKGFIFIGDGGPFTGSTDQMASTTIFPMKVNIDNTPQIFVNGGRNTANAHLFCNVMAWAVDYINTKRNAAP